MEGRGEDGLISKGNSYGVGCVVILGGGGELSLAFFTFGGDVAESICETIAVSPL